MYGGFDTFGYEPFVEVPATATDAFGVAGFLFGFLAVFYLIVFAFSIALYIFQSIGVYTVAKRRGINNPWLAWIPVGILWILGSISDQYQYVAKGKVRNRRKILLGLSIAVLALVIPVIISLVVFVVAAVAGESAAAAGIGLVVMLLFELAMLVVDLILIVFTYIVMYDFYASCDPSNATTYLILSIFFTVTQPFFMFFSRKKDWGMPPRKEETQPSPQPIAEIPAEPVAVEEAATEEIPVAEVISVAEEAPVAEEEPAVEETPEETE